MISTKRSIYHIGCLSRKQKNSSCCAKLLTASVTEKCTSASLPTDARHKKPNRSLEAVIKTNRNLQAIFHYRRRFCWANITQSRKTT